MLILLTSLVTAKDHDASRRLSLVKSNRERFLERHNFWRNQAATGNLQSLIGPTPRAKAMPMMTWDSSLEQASQRNAEMCKFAHSGDPGVGENIFVTSRDFSEAVVDQTVESWVDEVADYNPATKQCNRVCGHYTQVVWAKSTMVGCGVAQCPSIRGVSFGGTLVFCQYKAPGNFNRQFPYETTSGAAGGGCASKASTFTGLCANGDGSGISGPTTTGTRPAPRPVNTPAPRPVNTPAPRPVRTRAPRPSRTRAPRPSRRGRGAGGRPRRNRFRNKRRNNRRSSRFGQSRFQRFCARLPQSWRSMFGC